MGCSSNAIRFHRTPSGIVSAMQRSAFGVWLRFRDEIVPGSLAALEISFSQSLGSTSRRLTSPKEF